MNGQFRALPSESAAGRVCPSAGRLCAALAASVLLHLIAAIVFFLALDPVRSIPFKPAGGGAGRGLFATLLPAAGGSGEAPAAETATDPQSPVAAVDEKVPQAAPDETGNGGGPLRPQSTFYPSGELTRRPQALTALDLDVSGMPADSAAGKVVMKLWVDESGAVVDIDVETADLPEPILSAAVAAFRKMHFKPGELDGRVVGSVMRIEVGVYDGSSPR